MARHPRKYQNWFVNLYYSKLFRPLHCLPVFVLGFTLFLAWKINVLAQKLCAFHADCCCHLSCTYVVRIGHHAGGWTKHPQTAKCWTWACDARRPRHPSASTCVFTGGAMRTVVRCRAARCTLCTALKMRGSLPVQHRLFKAGDSFTSLRSTPPTATKEMQRWHITASLRGTDMPCFLNKWFFCISYAFSTGAVATNIFWEVHLKRVGDVDCSDLQPKVSHSGGVHD